MEGQTQDQFAACQSVLDSFSLSDAEENMKLICAILIPIGKISLERQQQLKASLS